MLIKVFLLLFSTLVVCQGVDDIPQGFKNEFLKNHCLELGNDLICSNVNLSKTDAKVFEDEEFTNLKLESLIFDGGNVGIVNSDFFKHFPNVSQLKFFHVSMDLKPSEDVEENTNIEKLIIYNSTILRNKRTNAFHSLSVLKEFDMSDCHFEHPTIDGDLLEMNENLASITLTSSEEPASLIKHIDDDAFDKINGVRKLRLFAKGMSKAPASWYQFKPLLDTVHLLGFEEFPEDVPTEIQHFQVSLSQVKQITRDNLKSLKNLISLSIRQGEVEVIDEDAFDDLKTLRYLDLSDNKINKISRRHLDKLALLTSVDIRGNPIYDLSLFDALRIISPEKGLYFRPPPGFQPLPFKDFSS